MAPEEFDKEVNYVDGCLDPGCDGGSEDDLNITSLGGDEEENRFDYLVGTLENVLAEPGFNDPLTQFCKEHCTVFEDSEENKLEYTVLFEQYSAILEVHIENRMAEEIPGFSMEEFVSMASSQENLDGDVFDLLLTLSDFEAFKDLMLSYKKEVSEDTPCLALRVQQMHLQVDEQEDGEVRPDLDQSLQISPLHKQAAAAGTGVLSHKP